MRLLVSVVLVTVLVASATTVLASENLSTNASEARQTVTVDEGSGTSFANTKGMKNDVMTIDKMQNFVQI